jgi:hypothetical protein
MFLSPSINNKEEREFCPLQLEPEAGQERKCSTIQIVTYIKMG